MRTKLQTYPCEVLKITKRDTRLRPEETEWIQAELIDFYQFSKPIGSSPMIGGHNGGTVAYPIALIMYDDGQLDTVNADDVRMIKED